jgi:hypothetical protein
MYVTFVIFFYAPPCANQQPNRCYQQLYAGRRRTGAGGPGQSDQGLGIVPCSPLATHEGRSPPPPPPPEHPRACTKSIQKAPTSFFKHLFGLFFLLVAHFQALLSKWS